VCALILSMHVWPAIRRPRKTSAFEREAGRRRGRRKEETGAQGACACRHACIIRVSARACVRACVFACVRIHGHALTYARIPRVRACTHACILRSALRSGVMPARLRGRSSCIASSPSGVRATADGCTAYCDARPGLRALPRDNRRKPDCPKHAPHEFATYGDAPR
jgi:hypothetical protein